MANEAQGTPEDRFASGANDWKPTGSQVEDYDAGVPESSDRSEPPAGWSLENDRAGREAQNPKINESNAGYTPPTPFTPTNNP